MSSTKAALKTAKIALDGRKYDEAINQTKKVLEIDPRNYHAYVFLGLAHEKTDRDDESEKAYKAAVNIKDEDVLAWQGLITLYEKQGSIRIDDYQTAALKLAKLFMDLDDIFKCQSVVDKYTKFVKQHGTRIQQKHALELISPTSCIYDYLEGRIPHPSYTYTKIVEIVEAKEKEKINKEIGERRTRLGAKIGQVTAEVKREVLGSSDLEPLYSHIIDWTQDDDTRRLYEEKKLQHAYDTLIVLPTTQKTEKRIEVQKQAEGLVILKQPYLLAWKIVLEWTDVEAVEQLDVHLLRDYITHFPEDGLTKVLRGYLGSDISPFLPLQPDLANQQDENKELLTTEDRLLLMVEGLEESTSSALSNRLIAEYYLHLEEFASTVEAAKGAKEALTVESQTSGLKLQETVDAVNITLATALVQHETPRNHREARSLFDEVLKRKPINTAALIGVGLILEEEEDYPAAIDFLGRASQNTTDIKVKAETAWCKALNGDLERGLRELDECLSQLKDTETRTKHLKAQLLYRSAVCIWKLDSSKAARKDRNQSYARFLAALQADMTFAPAYTYLGIYYADYARDMKRARKCFQKAFELSASELEAAERLARAFADQGEWDLVQAVSQRVIDSGKVRPPPGSKKKGLSWPFAALGVVFLNNQEYAQSIVSFQSALRLAPDNYHCWVGLGESYHNSGRYVAATRAFEQAQKLERDDDEIGPENSWFAGYMLANVNRELGEYEEAIEGYTTVLNMKPSEFGVMIALLQTHVESAWRNIELGFFGRAVDAAVEAINIAKDIVAQRADAFNLWRAVGDACAIFSWAEAYTGTLPLRKLTEILETELNPEALQILADIDDVGKNVIEQRLQHDPRFTPTVDTCLQMAILAYKRAIASCDTNVHAQAVAWYNLGWAEYRAQVCTYTEPSRPLKRSNTKYLSASVRCFKRAIELEASNAEFWNALGVVTTTLSPKVSQHAFVRSLHLNERSARSWTNLGGLYLLQNDHQLAGDAFTRAQSADPDYALAWLGQGLLALLFGEIQEAQGLFTHSFEIADSTSVMTKKQYSLSTFDSLLSRKSSEVISDVLQPLFALRQLHSQISDDPTFSHLTALFAERIKDYTEAIARLNEVGNVVEAEYEKSEADSALAQFAQAKADLARIQLAIGDFEGAITNAETALDLSTEGESGNLIQTSQRKYRLSAHLTAGLAYDNAGDIDKAIEMFRSALEETNRNPDTVCILSQMLWAKGGREEQDVARVQLLECVERNPDHVGATNLLGVIAILDKDHDTMESVTADLRSLRMNEGLSTQQHQQIGRVLTALTLASARTKSKAEHDVEMTATALAEASTAVMLAPSESHGWTQLAALTDESNPADMAVVTAMRAAPPQGSLDARDLCLALSSTTRAADAQRAIMVAPWEVVGWKALND
ncbi:Superkiller protein 3 [Bachmanniomyces sp. S44760]|nr:Superkiller protein 3 [Bachmanniomyces sp. S44760]